MCPNFWLEVPVAIDTWRGTLHIYRGLLSPRRPGAKKAGRYAESWKSTVPNEMCMYCLVKLAWNVQATHQNENAGKHALLGDAYHPRTGITTTACDWSFDTTA